MVKVVGRDAAAVKRVTCPGCASVLEYTLSEVKKFTSYDYGGGSDIVSYITCPGCSHQVHVRGY